MAYERTIWKNREVERPRTYEKVTNPDGTITLLPSEGNIIEEGTPIIAENMNKIEQGVQDAHVKADTAEENAKTYADGVGSAAVTSANAYTDQEVGEVANELTSHKNEIATNAHLAKNIGLQSINFEANNVEDGMNELFTSVSNGKSLIAGAITDKGVPTLPSDTFQVMANNINQIPVGDYSIGDILPLSSIEYYLACIWSFTEHTGNVNAVAVDNNGYVYSGSRDNTVRKISSSGTQVWSFTEHTDDVYAVAVDNNSYVYSGGFDETVRKISPSGTQVWSFTGHTDDVYAVAVDNDRYVYSGSDDNIVRKISPSGSQVWKFTGHTDWVRAVAVDNNGYVYSGSDDGTVRKINPSGTQVWSFTGHTGWVRAVAVDNNGYVYSGSEDETVRKINPSGTQVWSFTGHTDYVRAVAVDNDGYVYSGSYDDTVIKIIDGIKIIA